METLQGLFTSIIASFKMCCCRGEGKAVENHDAAASDKTIAKLEQEQKQRHMVLKPH